MEKWKNMLAYVKKHDFFATTLLCAAVVIFIWIGFQFHGLFALMQNQESEDTMETCPVGFRDMHFAKAVADALACDYKDLTEEVLQNATTLEIYGNPDIQDIRDIIMLPNLEKLVLKDCNIVSVEALSELKMLKELNLSGNDIRDITSLLDLPDIEHLDISNNPIEHVPDLSEVKQLRYLSLSNCSLHDFSFLKGSPVKELDISYMDITEISVLSTCHNLETLYLYGYNSMDLSPLHELQKFHSIFLSGAFDRSSVDFMVGRFMNADYYTKVYLVLKNRGMN